MAQAWNKILLSGFRIIFNPTGLMPLLLSDNHQTHWHHTCITELCSLGLSPKYLGQLILEKAKSIIKERIRDIDKILSQMPWILSPIVRQPQALYCRVLKQFNIKQIIEGPFLEPALMPSHHPYWREDFTGPLIHRDFAPVALGR